MARLRFPKEERLLRRSDFLRLSHGGQKVHVPHFIVLRKSSDKGLSRVGITVSRKVGNSVVRNRVKRLVREWYRQHPGLHSGSYDLNIIAKTGAGGLGYLEVSRELEKAFVQLAGQQ